jgi:hypothetical protein
MKQASLLTIITISGKANPSAFVVLVVFSCCVSSALSAIEHIPPPTSFRWGVLFWPDSTTAQRINPGNPEPGIEVQTQKHCKLVLSTSCNKPLRYNVYHSQRWASVDHEGMGQRQKLKLKHRFLEALLEG